MMTNIIYGIINSYNITNTYRTTLEETTFKVDLKDKIEGIKPVEKIFYPLKQNKREDAEVAYNKFKATKNINFITT